MYFKHPLNPVSSNYNTLIIKCTQYYKLEEERGERSFLLITQNFLTYFWA